jgi:hypothetical protein
MTTCHDCRKGVNAEVATYLESLDAFICPPCLDIRSYVPDIRNITIPPRRVWTASVTDTWEYRDPTTLLGLFEDRDTARLDLEREIARMHADDLDGPIAWSVDDGIGLHVNVNGHIYSVERRDITPTP